MPASSSSSARTADGAVEVRLRPSVRLLWAAMLLHSACLALLIVAEPPTVPMLLLAAGIGGSWLWVRRHPALGFGQRAIDRMLAHGDGAWTLQCGRREPITAALLDESIVRGPLLVLRFRTDAGQTLTRALAGDETAPEMLRRLRTRLMA
jgi:toxin CptA